MTLSYVASLKEFNTFIVHFSRLIGGAHNIVASIPMEVSIAFIEQSLGILCVCRWRRRESLPVVVECRASLYIVLPICHIENRVIITI